MEMLCTLFGFLDRCNIFLPMESHFYFFRKLIVCQDPECTIWTLISLCRGIHLPCVQGLHVSSGLDWHIRCPCLQLSLWCHLLDGPWTWVLVSKSLTLSLAWFSCMDPGCGSPYLGLLMNHDTSIHPCPRSSGPRGLC